MSTTPIRAPLATADLDRLRRTLTHKREVLLDAQRASRAEQRGVGEPESEAGDAAEQIIVQDDALRLASFDAGLLAEVERALAKIEAGTYGLSEDSGAPIPLERLELVPWARRTADEEERHRR